MITRSRHLVHAASWQQLLAAGFQRPEELLRELQLEDTVGADLACQPFALRVPRGFVARMEVGNPRDPLLLQVLPSLLERKDVAGFTADPLQELEASPAAGVIHKYRGRVLLVTTAACAVHCRYCFRRHFPYQDHGHGRARWGPALDYIGRDASISEVILSGGDPLTLADGKLAELVTALEAIPHLRRLRLHSRLPVVLPERITPELLALLAGSRLHGTLVVHSNHPREIDVPVARALRELRAQGVTVLNQTVLLRGVNDDANTLVALSETLFDAGTLPYYLHLLDRVAGAAHFAVSEPRARRLYREIMEQLPGYLVPKLVVESPRHAFKKPLTPSQNPSG